MKAGKLPGVPSFPTITVKNARKGFLEEADFARVMAHLPEEVQPLVRFFWLTGRRKGEALGLEWRNVDLVTGTIRIEDTKSREPRTLPFYALPELDALIRYLRERTTVLEKRRRTIVRWVFHRSDGRPIRGIRRAWVTACIAARLGVEEKDEDGKVVRRVPFRILHEQVRGKPSGPLNPDGHLPRVELTPTVRSCRVLRGCLAVVRARLANRFRACSEAHYGVSSRRALTYLPGSVEKGRAWAS